VATPHPSHLVSNSAPRKVVTSCSQLTLSLTYGCRLDLMGKELGQLGPFGWTNWEILGTPESETRLVFRCRFVFLKFYGVNHGKPGMRFSENNQSNDTLFDGLMWTLRFLFFNDHWHWLFVTSWNLVLLFFILLMWTVWCGVYMGICLSSLGIVWLKLKFYCRCFHLWVSVNGFKHF
jgi:hypothetical protein